MKTIGIFGFGKFGKFVSKLFNEKCANLAQNVFDQNSSEYSSEEVFLKAAKSDLIFTCVPIGAISEIVEKITPYLNKNQVIVDVASVKTYPKEIYSKILDKTQVLLTHPMFGPATVSQMSKDGKMFLDGLNITVENLNLNEDNYNNCISFLKSLNLEIHTLSANEHDKLTSNFQFTSLFFSSLLKEFDFKESKIDTVSYKKLIEFTHYVSADKNLLKEFYLYNPYCKEQIENIKSNFDNMYEFVKI